MKWPAWDAPVRGGLILETARMKRILSIDRENRVAVVQPGNQPANGALREALLCETPVVGGLASEDVLDGDTLYLGSRAGVYVATAGTLEWTRTNAGLTEIARPMPTSV